MLRIALTSYPRCNFQLVSATCSRNAALSSFRLCSSNVRNFENDNSQSLKYVDEPIENRALPKRNPSNMKSFSFRQQDEVSNLVRLFESVEDVLEYLRNNPAVDPLHYRRIFSTIIKLHETGRSKLSAEEICRSEEFEKLAKDVERNVHSLKVDEACTVLKVLIDLGISTNSTLCQSLLRTISKRINKLNTKTIMFLDLILSRCTRSPIVDDLETSLSKVFETQVRSRLDPDDSRILSKAVCFAFKCRSISAETRELLTNTALDNVNHFQAKEILGMLKKLTFGEDDPKNTRDLYTRFSTSLRENFHQLETTEYFVTVVRVIVNNYLTIDESFFDHELVEIALESVIGSKEFCANDVGVLLRILNKTSYYCPALLEYIDENLKQYTDFSTLPRILIFSFVISCSNCSFKPKNWNTYEEQLLSYLTENKGDFSWILATDLMILKCWPKAIVEYCFQEEQWCQPCNVAEEEDKTLSYRTMLTLYQVVKSLYSSYYTGPYPSASIIDGIVKYIHADKQYPLLDSLKTGLGGLQYVMNGVTTKSGQIIDYLIVKCKTGELYPINPTLITDASQISYESLHMPEDSYPIAITLLNPSAYCLDGVRMRGRTKIKIRCLEVYGITTIPLSHYEWLELEEDEKVPYLTCKIDNWVPVSSSKSKYC